MASSVLIFLGAGASKPFGIPTTKEFVGKFATHLKESEATQEEIELYADIRTFLVKHFEPKDDIENILTILNNFAGDITVRKLGPTADYYIHKYYAERLRGKSGKISLNTKKRKKDIKTTNALADKLKKFVFDGCSFPDQSRILEVYDRFFERVASATPTKTSSDQGTLYPPCEIFTTNYDLCVETYCRSRQIELNRGIEYDKALQYSTLKFRNYDRSYNVRLFKLHGSIDLYTLKNGHIIHQSTSPLQSGSNTRYGDKIVEEWMIYPIQEKYIYQEPFFSMFNEFKRQLKVTDNWIIVGHSFRDDAIKNIFIDAPKKGKKIAIIDKNAEKIVNENLSPISNMVTPIEGGFESEEVSESLFEFLK